MTNATIFNDDIFHTDLEYIHAGNQVHIDTKFFGSIFFIEYSPCGDAAFQLNDEPDNDIWPPASDWDEEREANETAELDAYLDSLLSIQNELTKMGEQS